MQRVRLRYLSILVPIPGLAILATGIASFYYYYNRFAILGDPSGFTPLLWDVFEIAGGAVLTVTGTLAQIKWSKLRASVVLLRRLVLAFGLIVLGFVFVIIELATDTLVCVRSTSADFGPVLGPAQTCLQYGYAHQFLWLGALGSGMVLLGILVSALEEKRQFQPHDPHYSSFRET
jgi:hypothetical protein